MPSFSTILWRALFAALLAFLFLSRTDKEHFIPFQPLLVDVSELEVKIISISLSTARLKHRSLQNSLKCLGLSPKNDSISLIASRMSCKCLFIFSSIYQSLCRINTFSEIRIFMDCSSTKSTFLPNKSCNEYLKSK